MGINIFWIWFLMMIPGYSMVLCPIVTVALWAGLIPGDEGERSQFGAICASPMASFFCCNGLMLAQDKGHGVY
jgi:hypothetical protein